MLSSFRATIDLTYSRSSFITVMGDVQNLGGEIEASHKLLQAQLVKLQQKLDKSIQDTNYATSAELSKASRTMKHSVKAMMKESQLIHRTESILKALRVQDIVYRQSQILEAHPETFRWALSEKSSLASWLRGDHTMYWIQGKAGSGKSTLMKYLWSEKKQIRELLRNWAGDRPVLLASHYFWAIGTPLQSNIEGLLRNLLFRIFVQSPFLLKDVCSERLQSYHYLDPWTFEELRRCFIKLSEIPDLRTKFCFLIDGLDESRHPQQAASLTQEITQVADGVFLWVYYAIRDLLRGLTKFDSLSDLVARLKGIPKNLEDYFARMLDSIDEEDYYETSMVLIMVAATESPLTTLHTWAARES